MTKKESHNGSTMGINHYAINEKVSKTRVKDPELFLLLVLAVFQFHFCYLKHFMYVIVT